MAAKNHEEVIPSAKRLIRSLRDLGYDFPTAVADIVDNSIEAGASDIQIEVEFQGKDSFVRITDNGIGMSLNELREAMRYGSEKDYDSEKHLGRFGLGLKTASMSQCRRMVVASRNHPKRPAIAFSWDLEHIEATNKWEIIKIPKQKLMPITGGKLQDGTGTVVFWQHLDRILEYKAPDGLEARNRINAMCRELEGHLAMVFHRFLAGEIADKTIRITLNGVEIQPWDPFARSEKSTQRTEGISLLMEHRGRMETILVEPFILPHQDEFSSREAFNRAAGPNKWNRQQGFYIYRANRMIQSGGWSRTRTVDEHTKLARVAISFGTNLDEAFKINVAKMKVQLPSEIREQLEASMKPVLKIAQEVYRKKARTTIESPVHSGINSIKANKKLDGRTRIIEAVLAGLEDLATPDERLVLLRVIERFRKVVERQKDIYK